MSLKGGGQQTTTQALDPATQRMQAQIYSRAQDVANEKYSTYGGPRVAGANPATQAALTQYGQVGGLAGLGGRALGGDAAAFGQFMNPYQQNVIDQVGNQYDQLRSQAHLDANDAATRAGAFGGSRHAIAEGARLGQLDQGQAATVAQLQQQGFNDAQGRAAQAVNLGLSGLQGQAGLADYLRQIQQQGYDANLGQFNEQRDWGLRGLQALQGAVQGTPYGQSQSTPLTRNAGAGALGGALTGAQIGSAIPGVGTAIGAIGGGLLGLFG